MNLSRFSTGISLSILLGTLIGVMSCSPYQHAARGGLDFTDPASMQIRLHDVAFPLLVEAAEWCPFEQEPTYGFLLHDKVRGQNGAGGTGKSVVVTYVHPLMPAAKAGLFEGDELVQVNTQRVEGEGADAVTHMVRGLTLARIQPLLLEVFRAGEHRVLTMRAVPACQFSLQVIQTDEINGRSDGREIVVSSGAIRFFVSDDELAWVLAHEIAHNILSHVQNAKLRMMLSTFLSATTGTSPSTKWPELRSLEAQADYVGSYLMARAGYDLDAIRSVWNRLRSIESQQDALGHTMAYTHPATAERLMAFEETLKEIEARRRRGESLRPRFENIP